MILLMFSVFLKTIFLVPDYQWFHSKIKHILKTELCTILDRYVGTQLPTAKHKSSDQFVDYYFFCSEEVKLSQFSIEWINNDKFSLTRFLFQFFTYLTKKYLIERCWLLTPKRPNRTFLNFFFSIIVLTSIRLWFLTLYCL